MVPAYLLFFSSFVGGSGEAQDHFIKGRQIRFQEDLPHSLSGPEHL